MKAAILQFIRQFFVLSAALGAALLFVFVSYAWTGPTASPPSNNTAAPLNVSASAQTKAGALTSSVSITSPQFCIGAACITSWASVGAQACPSGFTAVNGSLCIETNERPATTWYVASNACGAIGANLCSQGQWYNACTQGSGLATMIDSWEWIDDHDDIGSTYGGTMVVVGSGSCTASTRTGATTAQAYRCCFQR